MLYKSRLQNYKCEINNYFPEIGFQNFTKYGFNYLLLPSSTFMSVVLCFLMANFFYLHGFAIIGII